MNILIAILNNISDWLVKKLSKKIIFELWFKIEFENNINCEVVYDWNTSDRLEVSIVTEEQLDYDNELNVMSYVGDINDKYPMISINAVLYTKNEWNETHGGLK